MQQHLRDAVVEDGHGSPYESPTGQESMVMIILLHVQLHCIHVSICTMRSLRKFNPQWRRINGKNDCTVIIPL